jgi:hypothetical protein
LNRLKSTGLPIETGSGGLTKFNRTERELPKEHWIDAACIGLSTPEKLDTTNVTTYQGCWSQFQADDQNGQVRLSPHVSQSLSDGQGLSDRRSRQGYCAGWKKTRHLYWEGRSQKQRKFQHRDQAGNNPGHQLQALPDTTPSRRIFN